MAFNWQTFKTRALTAILFVVVMLVGLLWNEWSFLILFSIIHFGCWWEYLKIMEKIHNLKYHPYVKLGFMVLGYGLMVWFCDSVYEINGYGIKGNISLPISIAGFVLLIMGIFQKTKIKLSSFAGAFVGLFYISLSWGLLIYLRGSDAPFLVKEVETFNGVEKIIYDRGSGPFIQEGLLLALTVIFTMWINDTMAYLVGSLIGKRPLTKISPKKTWEGTVGGIILAVIGMGLLSSSFYNSSLALKGTKILPVYFWYGLIAFAAIAGTFGDILESKLKRMANIKDSGHIMPGHGGFLDRFDSLILAVPFCWLYVFLFQRL